MVLEDLPGGAIVFDIMHVGKMEAEKSLLQTNMSCSFSKGGAGVVRARRQWLRRYRERSYYGRSNLPQRLTLKMANSVKILTLC